MVQERLKAAGFLAPGIELLTVGPNRTELRYFKQSDVTEAQQIAKTIASAGVPPTVVLVPGFEQSTTMRPKHYELWLASARASAE
jgi:pyridoxal/pyridoxine/pyridoxamine kinase